MNSRFVRPTARRSGRITEAGHELPAPVAQVEPTPPSSRAIVDAEGNTFAAERRQAHRSPGYAMDSGAQLFHAHPADEQEKWDSLTEQQQIITEAAKEATVWQRAESVKLEKKAWDAFKAKGIEITMLTPGTAQGTSRQDRPAQNSSLGGNPGRIAAADRRQSPRSKPDARPVVHVSAAGRLLFLLHHRNLAWKRPTLPSRAYCTGST